MLKGRLKSVFALLVIFTLFTCVDPYVPEVGGYEKLLVVDGLITDENSSFSVKLSRTYQDIATGPSPVTDATVYISDDANNTSYLTHAGSGIYKTDSTQFRGYIGRTYSLHILTPGGEEYESEAYAMQSVPEIDSIYYARDQQLNTNGTISRDGLSIYIDSKEGEYYRWTFEETWKFKIPYPKEYIYANCEVIYQVPKIKDIFCWKRDKSIGQIFGSAFTDQFAGVMKQPVTFIATDQSDKLTIQYSILVNQYSISKDEYNYLNNLEKVNAAGGDIFSSLPYSVTGNVHNIKDHNERVLGYFQVSAVKKRRKFISFDEIKGMGLPNYHYPCNRVVIGCVNPFIDDYCDEFNNIYQQYCIRNDYYFIEPLFKFGSLLDKLVFVNPECANCQLTGSIKRPDFWIDVN